MKFIDLKEKFAALRYKPKCKKLNITDSFYELICNGRNSQDILKLIDNSKDLNDFRKNVINYLKSNPQSRLRWNLAFGNLIGIYESYRGNEGEIINLDNIENFDIKNKEKILSVLRNNFYDYVMNNNIMKNRFYKTIDGLPNYTYDIDKEEVYSIFDKAVEGNYCNNNVRHAYKYICTIVNRYSLDDILYNFDFINFDMLVDDSRTLDEKRKEFNEHKSIGLDNLVKINNINVLKNKLKSIGTIESQNLLNRLNNIVDPYSDVDEINDIYFEYEYLIRKDILNRLYVPNDEETNVDDFRKTKPQLIHCLIRETEKFRDREVEKIKNKIISERTNGDKNPELTNEEMERFQRLLSKLDVELNQAIVNYSYEGGSDMYSNQSNIEHYVSDTSNQISASVYSDNFFIKQREEMVGIGFNAETVDPEAIIMSAEYYLTTNRGVNNIEYDTRHEFEVVSSPFNELIKNDGGNEVVMFRRGMDFDTKAAYVFVSYDSEKNTKYNELIERGRTLAQKSNMKLVLYDLAKIRQSYLEYNQDDVSEKAI